MLELWCFNFDNYHGYFFVDFYAYYQKNIFLLNKFSKVFLDKCFEESFWLPYTDTVEEDVWSNQYTKDKVRESTI